MNVTFHRSKALGRHAAPGALIVLAALVLTGCSQLAGVLAGASATPAVATEAVVPSAGPETPVPTAAGERPAASASVGSHVGNHAIVCVQPITPGGGGGPPCVPVSDALVVAAAMDVLTPAERAAVGGSDYVAGHAACDTSLPLAGCLAPDVPLGVVTFRFDGGLAAVRVLVYHGADGTLGATRLG